jgi:release factor glutamine methyltransferase
VGIGSGLVICSLAKILSTAGYEGAEYTGLDINKDALSVAQRIATQNNIQNITFKESNLFADCADQKFDIVIFNPPYVVTSADELAVAQDQKGIEASWAGGQNGIQVLLDFVP